MSPDLLLALELADAADRIALAGFRKAGLVVEQKPDLTPVTEADRAVEKELRRLLAETRPEDAVLGEEQQAKVEAAIADLPDMYREVFVLADVEQMGNAEIAEVLGLSVPAVKSRLHRARMMMRDRLAPYFEEARA
jgi:RNA polymerase sigma factor (sigma-70 family)